MRPALALLALLAVPALGGMTDDEMRVINAVVDVHVEEAHDFWDRAHVKHYDTMRGLADAVAASRLAVVITTIRPLAAMGDRHDYAHLPEEDRFDAIRKARTPLYRDYAALRGGTVLAWLRARRDLLVVPKKWTKNPDPEKFYAAYPDARGLLTISAPAVRGSEAFVYADLMMVFGHEGRVFHLRKEHGRWQIDWSLALYDMPGC